MTSDDHVETTGAFSDHEIVDSVLGREEEYEDEANDDDDEPIVCPTVAAYQAALEVVSCCVSCCSDDSRHDQALLSLEDLSFKTRSKQTNIADFSLQYSKQFSLWYSKLAFASSICSVHVSFLRLYSWLIFGIVVLYWRGTNWRRRKQKEW